MTKPTLWDQISDFAGWTGASYWCDALDLTDPETARVFDDVEEQERTISAAKVREALAVMAGGHYLDHTLAEQELRAYHARAAKDFLADPEDADMDADTWDIALQMALHGGVVYG